MARKSNSNDIAVVCPQCYRTRDNKAEFIGHMLGYQHDYSKAAAIRAYRKALALAEKEQREHALMALGYEECPNCKELSDAGLWKPMQFTRLADKPVCVDCQPVKTIYGVGGIYKNRYNESGYDYAFVGSEYTSSQHGTVEQVERMMRLHVAEQTDNAGIIEQEEDRKEYYRRAEWQRRMREIMTAGHDSDDARRIESGFKVCSEHSACAIQA